MMTSLLSARRFFYSPHIESSTLSRKQAAFSSFVDHIQEGSKAIYRHHGCTEQKFQGRNEPFFHDFIATGGLRTRYIHRIYPANCNKHTTDGDSTCSGQVFLAWPKCTLSSSNVGILQLHTQSRANCRRNTLLYPLSCHHRIRSFSSFKPPKDAAHRKLPHGDFLLENICEEVEKLPPFSKKFADDAWNPFFKYILKQLEEVPYPLQDALPSSQTYMPAKAGEVDISRENAVDGIPFLKAASPQPLSDSLSAVTEESLATHSEYATSAVEQAKRKKHSKDEYDPFFLLRRILILSSHLQKSMNVDGLGVEKLQADFFLQLMISLSRNFTLLDIGTFFNTAENFELHFLNFCKLVKVVGAFPPYREQMGDDIMKQMKQLEQLNDFIVRKALENLEALCVSELCCIARAVSYSNAKNSQDEFFSTVCEVLPELMDQCKSSHLIDLLFSISIAKHKNDAFVQLTARVLHARLADGLLTPFEKAKLAKAYTSLHFHHFTFFKHLVEELSTEWVAYTANNVLTANTVDYTARYNERRPAILATDRTKQTVESTNKKESSLLFPSESLRPPVMTKEEEINQLEASSDFVSSTDGNSDNAILRDSARMSCGIKDLHTGKDEAKLDSDTLGRATKAIEISGTNDSTYASTSNADEVGILPSNKKITIDNIEKLSAQQSKSHLDTGLRFSDKLDLQIKRRFIEEYGKYFNPNYEVSLGFETSYKPTGKLVEVMQSTWKKKGNDFISEPCDEDTNERMKLIGGKAFSQTESVGNTLSSSHSENFAENQPKGSSGEAGKKQGDFGAPHTTRKRDTYDKASQAFDSPQASQFDKEKSSFDPGHIAVLIDCMLQGSHLTLCVQLRFQHRFPQLVDKSIEILSDQLLNHPALIDSLDSEQLKCCSAILAHGSKSFLSDDDVKRLVLRMSGLYLNSAAKASDLTFFLKSLVKWRGERQRKRVKRFGFQHFTQYRDIEWMRASKDEGLSIYQDICKHICSSVHSFTLSEIASCVRSMAYLDFPEAAFFKVFIPFFKENVAELTCNDILNVTQGLNRVHLLKEEPHLRHSLGLQFQKLQAKKITSNEQGKLPFKRHG